MQQPPPPQMLIPPFPNANITTEQIQKYLDENKQLILAILDNQNLGKLAECAQFQAKLQHNLMYLAAIADAQPQTSAIPTQIPPQPMMQQGGQYMQHPHMAAGQASPFPQKVPMQFNQQQMQEQHQLHHQGHIQGHMSMRPVAPNGVHHPMHSDNTIGGSGGPPTATGLSDFARSAGASGASLDARGNKQDGGTVLETRSRDAHGSSAAGPSATDMDPSYKGSEGAKMP